MEYVFSKKDDLLTAVRVIDALAERGRTLPEIQEKSKQCAVATDPLECVFNYAFNKAVFRATPEDRQQLRTVSNILREGKANCTGYVTLMASILKNLNIPYIYRVTGPIKDYVTHIYLIANGKDLDCTIGQVDNELERQAAKRGYYNIEAPANYKKDFKSNMISVLNDQRRIHLRGNTAFLNGCNKLNHRPRLNEPLTAAAIASQLDPKTITAVTENLPEIVQAGKESVGAALGLIQGLLKSIWGDPCKRRCEFEHLNTDIVRKRCKEHCDETQAREERLAYNYAMALAYEQGMDVRTAGFGVDPKLLLAGAGAYLIYNLITK